MHRWSSPCTRTPQAKRRSVPRFRTRSPSPSRPDGRTGGRHSTALHGQVGSGSGRRGNRLLPASPRSSSTPAARSEQVRIRRHAGASSSSRGSSAGACWTPAAGRAFSPSLRPGSDSRPSSPWTPTRWRSRSAAETVRSNGVHVQVASADVLRDELHRTDVAVANIELGVVEALLVRLPASIAITSGYLESETPLVPGWEPVDRLELEGWAADVLARRH